MANNKPVNPKVAVDKGEKTPPTTQKPQAKDPKKK